MRYLKLRYKVQKLNLFEKEQERGKKSRLGDELPKTSTGPMNFEEVLKYINQCV